MMGCKFALNHYFLRYENPKTSKKRFTKTSDLKLYICQEGDYDKYLNKLPPDNRLIFRRHIYYTHVPGMAHEWKRIRVLELWEVIVFLNLLGFDKQDGCWTIPQGISLLEEDRYPTL
jgi:hypothetical protein